MNNVILVMCGVVSAAIIVAIFRHLAILKAGKKIPLLESIFNQPITSKSDIKTAKIILCAHCEKELIYAVPIMDGRVAIPARMGQVAMSENLFTKTGICVGQSVVLPPYGVFKVVKELEYGCDLVSIKLHSEKDAEYFGSKMGSLLVWIPWDGESVIYAKKL